MAKENKNQTTVNPEETPANEIVQNTVEAEVKPEDIQNPSDENPEDDPMGIQIVVVKRFKDKFDHKTLYTAGQELTFEEERANDLISRGLAKLKE